MSNTITILLTLDNGNYDEAFRDVLGFLTHYRCRYCGGTFSNKGDDQLSREASYFDHGGEA